MSVTPRLGKQPRHRLSLDDLAQSEGDSSDEEVILQEIAKLQQSVQNAKREKRQLEIRVQGLENDLLCAEKARELGGNAAVGVAKRLAALLGEALRDEDLVAKVQQLQERARKAKELVESLKAQLASLRITTPIQERDTRRRVDTANEEIQKLKLEEERATQTITDIKKQIAEREAELQTAKQQVSELETRMNSAVGPHWNPSDIRDRIVRNSESYVLDHCALVADSFGIELDPRMQASDFLQELRQKFADLQNAQDESKVTEIARQAETALSELNKANDVIRRLKQERKVIREQIRTRQPEVLEDFQSVLAGQRVAAQKRTRRLRQELKKAIEAVGLTWEVPKSHREVCAMYPRLIVEIQRQIKRLETDDDPRPDLSELKSKVDAVRRQNRQIRVRLRNL